MRFVNTKTIILLIAIIILLFIIKNIVSTIMNLNRNSQILVSLKKEEIEAKKRNQFLKERLYYIQTNDFIEKEARDKLGLVKTGEHIIIAPISKNKKVTEKIDTTPNWEKWRRLFF